MTVVVYTTPPLDGLPASDGESLRLLGTLKLAGVQAETRTAGWGANGESSLSSLVFPCPQLFPLSSSLSSCPSLLSFSFGKLSCKLSIE